MDILKCPVLPSWLCLRCYLRKRVSATTFPSIWRFEKCASPALSVHQSRRWTRKLRRTGREVRVNQRDPQRLVRSRATSHLRSMLFGQKMGSPRRMHGSHCPFQGHRLQRLSAILIEVTSRCGGGWLRLFHRKWSHGRAGDGRGCIDQWTALPRLKRRRRGHFHCQMWRARAVRQRLQNRKRRRGYVCKVLAMPADGAAVHAR